MGKQKDKKALGLLLEPAIVRREDGLLVRLAYVPPLMWRVNVRMPEASGVWWNRPRDWGRIYYKNPGPTVPQPIITMVKWARGASWRRDALRQMGLVIRGSYASMIRRIRPQARLIGHWTDGHCAWNKSWWVTRKTEVWLETDESDGCRLMTRTFAPYGFHDASGWEEVRVLATGLRTHRGLRVALEHWTSLRQFDGRVALEVFNEIESFRIER